MQAVEQCRRLACSGLHWADSLCTSQGHPPRRSSTINGLGPPTTFSNEENPHRLAWRPIWLKHFLNWSSLFPDVNLHKSMVSKEQQNSGGVRLCDSKLRGKMRPNTKTPCSTGLGGLFQQVWRGGRSIYSSRGQAQDHIVEKGSSGLNGLLLFNGQPGVHRSTVRKQSEEVIQLGCEVGRVLLWLFFNIHNT